MPINFSSLLKQLGRNDSQSLGASGQNNSFYYLIETADIDFRVDGRIGEQGVIGGSGGYGPYPYYGQKFIVENVDGLDYMGIDFNADKIQNGDIIERRTDNWYIHLDVSATGNPSPVKGTDGGALAYSKQDKKFYYYNGANWVELGSGTAGVTGDGGALAGVGNNTIRARLASTSLTGVASFSSSDFGVSSTGHVSLTGNVARTNVQNQFTQSQIIDSSSGLVVTDIFGAPNYSVSVQPARIEFLSDTVSQYLNPGVGIGLSVNLPSSSGTLALTNQLVASITAGHTGIALVGTTGNVQIFNMGVHSFNGQTGHVTFSGVEFDIGMTVAEPQTYSAREAQEFEQGTTGVARKIAFLLDDGSLTFDYIRNYDVFNQSQFQFAVLEFTATSSGLPFNSVRRLSSASYDLGQTVFNVSYRLPLGGDPVTGNISVSGSDEGGGFPLYFTTSGMTSFSAIGKTLTGGGGSDRKTVFTLTVQGADSNGSLRSDSSKTLTVLFRNDYISGMTNAPSISGGSTGMGSSWWSTRDFGAGITSQPLNEVLSGYKVLVKPTVDNSFIYFAYPSRIHDESLNGGSFYIYNEGGSRQLAGGMVLQGFGNAFDARGLSTLNYQNSLNYTESYKVWRSEQSFSPPTGIWLEIG